MTDTSAALSTAQAQFASATDQGAAAQSRANTELALGNFGESDAQQSLASELKAKANSILKETGNLEAKNNEEISEMGTKKPEEKAAVEAKPEVVKKEPETTLRKLSALLPRRQLSQRTWRIEKESRSLLSTKREICCKYLAPRLSDCNHHILVSFLELLYHDTHIHFSPRPTSIRAFP